jgi:glucose-fructose oxidoreductase
VKPPGIDRREVLIGVGAAAGLAACGVTEDSSQAKVGVAVLGIGELALNTIIPGIQESANCRLTGLISSSIDKLRELGAQFNVPVSGQYLYDDLERIADNPDIDFVYIAVPNALHAEYSIRAARAGKHVLCEKPMAVTVEQCEAMIAASAAAGKQLAVNYRFQFDPRYLEMQRLAREEVFGMAKLYRASIGFPLPREDWRLSRDMSGGLLMEQGVYAVSTACDMAGETPVEIVAHAAKSDPERFAEVEESIYWSMQFPSGAVAQCFTSYTVRMNELRVDAVSGYFELNPAYSRA